jgi:uncharacterized protein
MRVVIAGATGFIGRALTERLIDRGDVVTALTRKPERAGSRLPPMVSAVGWSLSSEEGGLTAAVESADAVVNLAGEPVAGKRWSAQQKERILNSRVQATTAIVDAITRAENRPRVLLNGSAIGYYGSCGDEVLTEDSTAGTDFLAGVVKQWEAATVPAREARVRVALIRTGIVLGTAGGALARLLLPFKLFSGGVMGPPGQWISWIHLQDEIDLIVSALDTPGMSGPINATAPAPVTMDVFSHAIGRALHRPVWVPGLPVVMGLALGQRSEVVFASQRVLPKRAQAAGFAFKHVDVEEALRSLIGRD